MKILVTGGAGFIGSSLVDALINAGHQVSIIDDLSSGKIEYINKQAKFYKLSINDQKISEIFSSEKFDIVYHLAAQIDVRVSVENPKLDNDINVLGGLNILENSKKFGVKKIIFSSTGGAIYGLTEEIPTSENSLTYPVSPYGINKLCFEKFLYYYYSQYNLNFSILRFANVYGPRQFKGGEAGVVAIFCERAVNNQELIIYGDGKQTRDFVYIDDVVSALILCLNIDCRGELNIATSLETNLWQIIEELEKVLAYKLTIKQEEAKLGEQRRSALCIKRAKEVINWQPMISLALGIKETINWTKKQVN